MRNRRPITSDHKTIDSVSSMKMLDKKVVLVRIQFDVISKGI
jgi:hypothetical protein